MYDEHRLLLLLILLLAAMTTKYTIFGLITCRILLKMDTQKSL